MPKKMGFAGIFTVFIYLAFFLGCEGDIDSLGEDEYGSLEGAAISLKVKWPDRPGGAVNGSGDDHFSDGTMMAAPVDLADECAVRGVDDVKVTVRDSAGVPLESASFDCSAGQGTLMEIKPQSECLVLVAGLDDRGVEIYRGRKTDVVLHPGMNVLGTFQLETVDVFTNAIGMTFNYIEPGTFLMGSPSDEPGRDSDETQHQVTLTQGYYMQTTEVTQGQWEAVMGSNPSYFSDCGDDCPVERVSWHDAQDFIDALNAMGEGTYRLPTEAEWEYAARAGSTTAFANGEITETRSGYDPVLDSMGWYKYNSNGQTHPVAQKDPNAWGLYDMHGNVWEWVADWYGGYPISAVTDPTGPSSGTSRVVRGGSCYYYAGDCRSAYRISSHPDGRYDGDFGFRLVLLPGH